MKKIYTIPFWRKPGAGALGCEIFRWSRESTWQSWENPVLGNNSLNILAALDKPTGGKVLLKGRDLTTIKEREMAAFRRQNLGFVFRNFNLLDTFLVDDNSFLPLYLAGKKISGDGKQTSPDCRAAWHHTFVEQISI